MMVDIFKGISLLGH